MAWCMYISTHIRSASTVTWNLHFVCLLKINVKFFHQKRYVSISLAAFYRKALSNLLIDLFVEVEGRANADALEF